MAMRIAPLALVVAVAAAGSGACKSDPGTSNVDQDAAGPDDSAFYDCTMETRAVAYAPDLQRASKKGFYAGTLVTSTPGPWVKGTNTWLVRIAGSGADGGSTDPAAGLTVKATPFMPDHNHGSSVKAAVTPGAAAGDYTVMPLYLYMSGYWEVTLDIAAAGDVPADSVMFPVCIPG